MNGIVVRGSLEIAMAVYIYWFLAALILIGLEMVTGTFYLLIVGIALAIGGISALLGFSFTIQLILAGLAGLAGMGFLRYCKCLSRADNKTQSLDVGQTVEVLIWKDDSTARVFYRGTEWDAELEPSCSGHEGVFYIIDIKGSVLILTKRNAL